MNAGRAKGPDDPLRLVVVCDMWLTGFDAPSMHTTYIDKPMRGYGLMQAITRVNRMFRDKPAGLVVDYIGISQNLKESEEGAPAPSGRRVGIVQGFRIGCLRKAELRQHANFLEASLLAHPHNTDRARTRNTSLFSRNLP